tara:strand:+ start:2002 stop:2184 length:183 start_codon:yes stop_codon:yes gene_type:complete
LVPSQHEGDGRAAKADPEKGLLERREDERSSRATMRVVVGSNVEVTKQREESGEFDTWLN